MASALDTYGLCGHVLDGQFRVDHPVGEGGFSVVYKGRHVGLGEPVAIKCLKLPGQFGTAIVESFVRRFRDEARIHYKLSQRSLAIARTIASGTTTSPTTSALVPYLVLEWLEGCTLADELRARRERGEHGRRLNDVMRLLDPVADAIATAHAAGVVHRDLNPSNIFLASQPGGGFAPKVLDFGIAKIISDHAMELGERAKTLAELHMFTPAYGAPEQFDERVGPMGTWTDVYSFGLLLTEMLSDRTPNEGDNIGELMARALNPISRPTPWSLGANVGDAVEALLARAIAVDPRDRPVDVGSLWGQLKHAAVSDGEADPGRASIPASVARTEKGTFFLLDDATTANRPPGPAQRGPTGTFAMRQNASPAAPRPSPPPVAASSLPPIEPRQLAHAPSVRPPIDRAPIAPAHVAHAPSKSAHAPSESAHSVAEPAHVAPTLGEPAHVAHAPGESHFDRAAGESSHADRAPFVHESVGHPHDERPRVVSLPAALPPTQSYALPSAAASVALHAQALPASPPASRRPANASSSPPLSSPDSGEFGANASWWPWLVGALFAATVAVVAGFAWYLLYR